MRLYFILSLCAITLLQTACIQRGTNPADPYEGINRQTHKFNMAFDATFLKPPARLYRAVVPGSIRVSINNAYENVNLIPTVANDLLQAQWKMARQDAARFAVNSTLGIAGFFDPASRMGFPAHTNDLGLTFAHWGDKNSPYIVIPFLGPSTIRDGMGLLFEYTLLTPYPYLDSGPLTTGLLAFRYVDLRAQLFDSERLMAEALDPYVFIRDAYLQHRTYLMNGTQETDSIPTTDPLYVEDTASAPAGSDYVDDTSPKKT